MAVTFDISPEKEASVSQFLYRQLFVTPRPTSRREVDLSGKTAIVTGSNIGIGQECARQLLDLGLTKLILGVRDESKGELARQNLVSGRNLKPDAIEVWKLDMSSYDSVTIFSERARNSIEHLDIAVLNAGVYHTAENFNENTGYEESVQVNCLSTVLLAILLLPIMKPKQSCTKSSPGRIVIVSSDTAGWAKFPERKESHILPVLKKKVDNFEVPEQYGRSKLLAQLALVELAKRVPSSAVTIDAANPGFCYGSGLQRHMAGTFIGFVFAVYVRLIGRSAAVGARTIVDAVVNHGEEVHGQYIEDCTLKPLAPIIYTSEGERVSASLWDELMGEFTFSGAADIIQSLKSRR
ncbi:uncharacterized protein F4807DRAFT_312920 [Annulohypoxylon truncatum]|uniref:uncharacterized protein n=1 Tax=Annulohypoxylon truncatum TaxID=327061 RepID=UPI0020085E55|nr:uncharacterized protein F4807DRAFT_312920 [Annulohypoxylon truncatum]KAI1213168.1 hypothetical protein F4807DRAFT_312920 [Annulohypoxylon truncatum]